MWRRRTCEACQALGSATRGHVEMQPATAKVSGLRREARGHRRGGGTQRQHRTRRSAEANTRGEAATTAAAACWRVCAHEQAQRNGSQSLRSTACAVQRAFTTSNGFTTTALISAAPLAARPLSRRDGSLCGHGHIGTCVVDIQHTGVTHLEKGLSDVLARRRTTDINHCGVRNHGYIRRSPRRLRACAPAHLQCWCQLAPRPWLQR